MKHGVIYYGSAEDYSNGGYMGTRRDYPTPGEFAAAVMTEWDGMDGWIGRVPSASFDVVPVWLAMRAFIDEDGYPRCAFHPYGKPVRGGTPGWWVEQVRCTETWKPGA